MKAKRFSLLLVWLVLLSGCSLAPRAPATWQISRQIGTESLWKVHVEKKEKEQLSGLLIVKEVDGRFRLLLMDATGVNLLAATLDSEGEMKIERAVKLLGDSRLPWLIKMGVMQIFADRFGEQTNYFPFRWTESHEEEDGEIVKNCYLGPFPFWSVILSAAGEPGHVVFRLPLQGITMRLALLDQ